MRRRPLVLLYLPPKFSIPIWSLEFPPLRTASRMALWSSDCSLLLFGFRLLNVPRCCNSQWFRRKLQICYHPCSGFNHKFQILQQITTCRFFETAYWNKSYLANQPDSRICCPHSEPLCSRVGVHPSGWHLTVEGLTVAPRSRHGHSPASEVLVEMTFNILYRFEGVQNYL